MDAERDPETARDRDSETERQTGMGATDSEMGEPVGQQDLDTQRNTESETGRHLHLRDREMQRHGERLGGRETEVRRCPASPQTRQTGLGSPLPLPPGGARPQTTGPCPDRALTLSGSWGLGWLGPGVGGEGRPPEAWPWPPPSDSPSSLDLLLPASLWGLCALPACFLLCRGRGQAFTEHLLDVPEMPPAPPDTLLSPLSLPLCPLLVLPGLLAPFLGKDGHLLSS